MTEAYKKYYNLFSTDDIGQLGIEFFNTIGHLCDTKPKYVERDPLVLIKEDLRSFVYLDDEKLEDLSCIRQISYVGRINDSIFEKQVDDGFISYFAVDVDVPFGSCASYIKNIQRILMKCANRHTIALYRVDNCFILAYGYRNVGKKSNVIYSDWIIDDESADIIMDNASIWYLSFRSLPRFAYDFQRAIRRDKVSKALSYEAIAYEIFPQYFEEFGFDEEKTPKREDRNEFVIWYRNQHRDEYDEFDDDSFFLTKDNMLDDDFEIDVDELEMQMLEAEMRGEEIFPSSGDDYEEMELSEFEQAIQIVDGGGDLSDAEDVLKQLDQADETEEETLTEFITDSSASETSATGLDELIRSFQKPTSNTTDAVISGMIEEIIDQANPRTPFKIRRTTWKRPDLYFVVEEIRGKYAYGYILDNGVIERRTSYPINNEKLKWNLQVSQEDSLQEEICYDGVNAKLCRRNFDLDRIASELKLAGIPTCVVGGKGFYKTQEVIDTYKLLNAIIIGSESAMNEVKFTDYYKAIQDQNIDQLIEEMEGILRVETVDTSLTQLYERSGILNYYRQRNNYQAVSNLLKLNELAQTLMDRDNMQPLQFVEYLYIMISTNQEEDEADIPEIERNNGVVSLYSIHKAKGLSFPIVVIPNCDNKLNRPITKPKIILDLKSEQPALAFNFESISQSLMPDSEYNRLLDANVREQLEEEIRVFYVACTRAEKQIIIANTKSKAQVMQTLQYRDYASVSRWLLEMDKEV